MSEPVQPLRPDLSHLITEDDEPVDNWFQERQQRLLTDSLYSSWSSAGQARAFAAAANVGLFYKLSDQAIVPDVLVSLDVTVPSEWWEQHNRSYMNWEFGKAPELVVEVVSNHKGGEEAKLDRYAQAGVAYVVLYDPRQFLGKRPLRVYVLHGGRYADVLDPSWLEEVGLGVTIWSGEYEGLSAAWLRWCDQSGNLLATGLEAASREKERADRLAARLKELGLDPE